MKLSFVKEYDNSHECRYQVVFDIQSYAVIGYIIFNKEKYTFSRNDYRNRKWIYEPAAPIDCGRCDVLTLDMLNQIAAKMQELEKMEVSN